jgi:hypothetical protein
MRFAPEPVKLRIANVFDNSCRFRIKCAPWPTTILALKNTAKLDIFAQIAPFRRTRAAAAREIDENGALPYKPRQLSAMARSDRGRLIWAGNGPFWAGQHHRTYLIIRQIARSAENDA